MKKILSVALSLVLWTMMGVAVSAENTTGGTIYLTYQVAETYTITIPESVTLGNSATISASGVLIHPSDYVLVEISETSEEDNAFAVRNFTGAALNYQVKSADGTKTYAVEDEVAKFSANGSVGIQFTAPTQAPVYAGTYTGTITFSVRLAGVA